MAKRSLLLAAPHSWPLCACEPQNSMRRLNMMVRGSPLVLVTRPNCGLVGSRFGAPKLVWFMVFSRSTENVVLSRS